MDPNSSENLERSRAPKEQQSDVDPISFPVALSASILPALAVLIAFWMALPTSEEIITYLLISTVGLVGNVLCIVCIIVIVCMQLRGATGKACEVCVKMSATWLLMVSLFLCFPSSPIISAAALTLIVPGILMVQQTTNNMEHFQTLAIALFIASFVVFLPFPPWIIYRAANNEKEDWKFTDWTEGYHDMVFVDGDHPKLNWKAAFVAWMLPVPVATELALLGGLCQISAKIAAGSRRRLQEGEHQGTVPETVQAIAKVKLLVMLFVAVTSILWIWLSLDVPDNDELKGERKNESDLRNDIGRLCVAFLGFTAVWIIVNLGVDNVYLAAKNSKVVERIVGFMRSDWAKAGVLCVFLPISPLYLCIRKCLHQQEIDLVEDLKKLIKYSMEKEKDDVVNSRPTSTHPGDTAGRAYVRDAQDAATLAVDQLYLTKLSDLLWKTPVLLKAQWLCLGFISFSVGVKLISVALAYTNELLSPLSVWPIAAAMCAIGTFLFLLPPTPGAPVYALSGIIVTAAANKEGWSDTLSIVLALFVGTGIKFGFASIAQKCIGEPLAKSPTVRSLAQITSLEVRACQKILSDPQLFTIAKVSILCGGPDWPVAVLCGIMRLSISRTMVSLTPIIIVACVPCTLSGSLLVLYAKDPDKRALGDTAVAIAGVLQMIAVLLAGYYIQETIEKHHEELEKRPEDPEDLKLLEEQEKYDAQAATKSEAFQKETEISQLGCCRKSLLFLGLFCGEVACLMLVLPVSSITGKPSFLKFEVTDSPSEKLKGNPLNLATTVGWVIVGLGTFAGLCLTLFFYCGGKKFDDKDDNRVESRSLLEGGSGEAPGNF